MNKAITQMTGIIQRAIALLYPPQCLACGDHVLSDFGLCAPCWRDMMFITTPFCPICALPLPGAEIYDPLPCDDCQKNPRPWSAGRAAIAYQNVGRSLVLALKHGDRAEIAKPAAEWMTNAGADLLYDNPLIVPVPLHWRRLMKRRYNQAALLASRLSDICGLDICPDLLIRNRPTDMLEDASAQVRFKELDGALNIHPKRAHLARGRIILLIDDVMTSGATLTTATHACLQAGAADIKVLTLARALRLYEDRVVLRDQADHVDL